MATEPQKSSSSIVRMVFFIFIGMLIGSILFTYLAMPQLSYNELKQEITNNNVATITIDGNGRIYGKLIKPTRNIINFQSYIPPGLISDFNKYLDEKSIRVTYAPGGPSFMSTLISWLPLIIILYIFWRLFSKASGNMGGGGGIMSFGKSKAKLSTGLQKKVTFKDVAGVKEAKEELVEIVEFLKNPQKFTVLGGHIPKGVLLVGAPGTGKTLLARAVAGEAGVPFYSISGSDFVEMFVGVGASRVRDLFDQAKKNAPCIIFIDEIDAIGGARSASGGLRHEEREQTLNQILSEMDGFEANEGVIILAATNMPNILDKALLRAGRFDRRVIVDKPDMQGRHEILQVHGKKIPLDSQVDLMALAKGTPGLVGAELANLLNEASLNAAKLGRKVVTQEDLEYAKDKVIMGVERKSHVISDKEKLITAYHEAGHTIVAMSVPEADPIHKVTIIPRGMSLGSTWQLPDEDKHSYSKVFLLSQLKILMGGRCAEEIVLKDITTGASNDIERATELARRMVCEWGMSDLGPIKFSSSGDSFLGYRQNVGNNNSEGTAQQIDNYINKFISIAYGEVLTILNNKKADLEKLAQYLLTKETLTNNEIIELLAIKES